MSVEQSVQLEVRAGNDSLRHERLTRELKDALVADEAVAAAGLRIEPVAPVPEPGSKGTLEAVVALLVAGAPYAQPTADVLMSAVQSWCARDRRVTVRVTDGDRSVDVVGEPSAAQRELIERFWHQGEDDLAS